MNQENNLKFFDNAASRAVDDLKNTIGTGGKVSVASTGFLFTLFNFLLQRVMEVDN